MVGIAELGLTVVALPVTVGVHALHTLFWLAEKIEQIKDLTDECS